MSGGGESYEWSCVEGSMTNWSCEVWGSDQVNDYAAENGRGRLALVASLPKNTCSAEKHLQ